MKIPKRRVTGLDDIEKATAVDAIDTVSIYTDIEVEQVLKEIKERLNKIEKVQKTIEVIDRYDEVFELEMEGWCYGITNYPGEVSDKLVFHILKALADIFKEALEHHVIFDIIDLSSRISRAAKYLVDERHIAFRIITYFPNPSSLTEEAQYVMGQIIDQYEKTYGGALTNLEKKWVVENKETSK